jgi:hypothetical protein
VDLDVRLLLLGESGRCNAAKTKIEDSLKEAGSKLRSALEDFKRVGAADPAQIIIAYNVDCLPK